MANINIILEAGLTNDYGVFNLNLNMLEYLNVDIISNGGCGKFSDFMIDTMYKLDTDEIDKIYNMRCCE